MIIAGPKQFELDGHFYFFSKFEVGFEDLKGDWLEGKTSKAQIFRVGFTAVFQAGIFAGSIAWTSCPSRLRRKMISLLSS